MIYKGFCLRNKNTKTLLILFIFHQKIVESSRRSFLERIVNLSIAGAGASLIGGIGYLAATEPPFPNYIFHGEIDGEHIALYRGKLTPIEDLQGQASVKINPHQ